MAGWKLDYALRVAKGASFKKFFEELNTATELSGQSKIFTAFDMARSFIKYGAGYYDYNIFQFWNLSAAQRDTYLTRFRSKKLNMAMNEVAPADFFERKHDFNQKFRDYLGREFLPVADASDADIEAFFTARERVFAKPDDLEGGFGMELLKTADFDSLPEAVAYVREKGFGVLEDVVENHPELARIYPGALNTMRMITLIADDGEPYLLLAVQKFGINGRVVDNYGVHGPLDLETGEFLFPAHYGDTKAPGAFTHHPNTGEKIVGFHTPFFKEAKEMVLRAAMVMPEVRYAGWDVAVTPNGPVIVEGNTYTAHDFWQLPGQTPGGIGIMPTLNKLIPSFKY